jgi:hypothetical protein
VQGHDFYARVREQRRIWRDLETDNLLFLAPRRVGKTSLMLRLAETAEDHGFRAVYVSVADVRNELGFVRRLYDAVLEGDSDATVATRLLESPVGRFLRSIAPTKVAAGPVSLEFGEGAAESWEDLGDALGRVLEQGDRRWLLMVDELPVFVLELMRVGGDVSRTRHFLNWFRTLRQRTDQVRWLLAGSIGLDTVAALNNFGDTINDLAIAEIGAFDEGVARAFVAALDRTHGLGLDEAVIAALVDRVGWPIPYFLQLLYRQLRNVVEDLGLPPEESALDKAFEELLQPAHRSQFDYWRQRLTEQLGRVRAGWAERLLTAACADPQGVTRAGLSQVLAARISDPDERDEALRFTLDVLQNDGYLVLVDGRYRFRAPLLRAWWARFHGG